MPKIPISAETADAFRHQIEAFEKKFGRPPGPEDPIFFDPDLDHPEAISQEKLDALMVESMEAAGLDPAFIYAYKKTGLLVSTSNWKRMSRSKRAAWNAAIREYEEMYES